MISRICLTLALASSLGCMAAQEKEKSILVIDPNQSHTKTFCQLTGVASLLTICAGVYKNNPQVIGCGIGLLTGAGCAAYEHKTNCSFVRSWIGEYLRTYPKIEMI